jgi:hypothetical protein
LFREIEPSTGDSSVELLTKSGQYSKYPLADGFERLCGQNAVHPQMMLCFVNKLDFIGSMRESTARFLFPWYLSVPEVLVTSGISGEVRRKRWHK